MRLSLVLPCFNEEANIEATVKSCLGWMREEGISGEVIVVNDGSTDGTATILQKIQEKCNSASPPLREGIEGRGSIKIITHSQNLGYGAAVRSGCDTAYESWPAGRRPSAAADVKGWIAFMDSDGQFDVKDFGKLLACLPQNKIVIGRRRHRADPFMRKVNAKLFGLLSFLVLGIWVRDVNCAMKVFHRDAWKAGRPTVATGAIFNAEFFYRLKKAGYTWKQVDVNHYPRKFGKQTGASLKVIVKMVRELVQVRMR
ncbi:cell wall biosynthesis glycosyltransferase [Candidatus Peregrinibacteria bacterium CG22_combo_CG10-13_8_21_14_all_49_11]|nr:MAG: cell wall biosynthesis glycosyltransferase [Candidatus Peregrinibacteria bacterium CG22_combo_CG10-13_8_21_14_all_49_11]